ncbi:PREDICTED: interferon lambda receptor 1, partial [Galeopterus variegatus]|uniref:Interferon lambda receptor 1 n=1 Tax=Galeopterus variegatus TaxID=482537 RepID=A0ABM0QXW1_GALVR
MAGEEGARESSGSIGQGLGGRPHLALPQNVTLLSQNFSLYLTWLPGPGNPQNVTYFVAYQRGEEIELRECRDLSKEASDGARRVEPAPPVLVFTLTEEILSASATYQLPPCTPPLDLKYEVQFWKEGTRNK